MEGSSFLAAGPREGWEQPKDWNRANKHRYLHRYGMKILKY